MYDMRHEKTDLKAHPSFVMTPTFGIWVFWLHRSYSLQVGPLDLKVVSFGMTTTKTLWSVFSWHTSYRGKCSPSIFVYGCAISRFQTPPFNKVLQRQKIDPFVRQIWAKVSKWVTLVRPILCIPVSYECLEERISHRSRNQSHSTPHTSRI